MILSLEGEPWPIRSSISTPQLRGSCFGMIVYVRPQTYVRTFSLERSIRFDRISIFAKKCLFLFLARLVTASYLSPRHIPRDCGSSDPGPSLCRSLEAWLTSRRWHERLRNNHNTFKLVKQGPQGWKSIAISIESETS